MSEESVMTINLTKQGAEDLEKALRWSIFLITDSVRHSLEINGTHPDRREVNWYKEMKDALTKAQTLKTLLEVIEKEHLIDRMAKEIKRNDITDSTAGS